MSVNLASASRKRLLMTAAVGLLLAATVNLQPWSPSQSNFAYAAASSAVISLNNEGVKALNAGNYQLAIQKFEAANKLDPTYTLAKENLAIAYNNYGLQLQNNPGEAIKWFHKSLALNANNATTQGNLNTIVQMLGKNPNSFKDRVDMGRAARLAGDFDGAIVEYAAALRIKDDAKLHADLGDVYRVRDRLDDAIREFQAALKSGVDPAQAADVNVKLGQAFQAKKDLKSAIVAYGEAIKAKPDDRDVLDALQAGWEQALRENPQAPENHIGLGQAFQYRGDFQQAEAEYKMALRFDPNNAIAKRLLAGMPAAKQQAAINKNINAGVDLQARKQYDLAIQQYLEALKADPKNVDVIVNIGTAYQAKGDYDNAITFYQKAQAIQPSNALAAQGIKASTAERQDKMLQAAGKAGQELFAAKKYPEALAAYQKVAAAHPEDAENHFNIGAVLQAMGRIDEAIAEYRQAIRIDKDNKRYPEVLEAAIKAKAEPMIAKAVEAHKAKDYTKAIDLYTQAIGLEPKNASLYYNLAGALYSRENYPEAQKNYEKAIEIDPKGQVDDLWLIGAIQEHLGDGYAAMGSYRKYASQAPSGKFIALAKDRLEALTKNPKDTVKIKNEAELASIASATDAYKAGSDAYQAKKYDEALASYMKAFNAVKNEPAYAYAVGTAYHAKGDFDNAVTWYNQAANLLKSQSKPDPQLVKDIPGAIQKAQADKAEPLAKAAVEKQTAGDLPGAIELYKQALQLIPNNAPLWTNLGSAYQNSDDFANARNAYNKALEIDKKTQCANYFLLGAIDEHFNRVPDALANYRKYITECGGGQFAARANDRVKILAQGGPVEKLATQSELKTQKAVADLFDAASKAQTAGNFDEAIAGYTKVLGLQPKEASTMFALGSAYQAKQDFANAIKWYQQAVDIASSPDQKAKYKDQIAEYTKYLGIAKTGAMQPLADEALKLFQAQDYKGASAKYREALTITPNDADLHLNLAAALQAADDFAGARPEYQKAYDLDPKGKANVLYFIGALQEHFGEGAKALDTYRQYVTKVPTGEYVSYAKQRIEALAKNVLAIVKIPTSQESKMQQATTETFDKAVKLQGESKFKEAIELYQQLEKQFPNEAAYVYAEGTAQQQLGNMDAAVTLYEKAVQLDSKNKDYQNVLFQAKQYRAAPLIDDAVKKHGAGDLPGAQEAYKKAIAVDPKNAKLHTNYAALLQQMDNFQGARDEFQNALNLDSKAEGEDYFYMAKLDEHLGRGAQANQSYQKYVAQYPTGQYAAEAKNRIKALTANPNAVVKMQTATQVKVAGEGGALFDEAVKLQQEKKTDDAIAKYNEALKLLPDSDAIWYSLATALFEKQDWDGAVKALEKAVSLKPTEAQYKTVLQQAKNAKGQVAAGPLLTSAIEKQTKLNDLKGAIADYEAALKLWDDPATHMNAGTAYQADNNFAGALSHYDRALALDPKLFDVLYYRGLVYENLKKPAQAIADYKRYLQMQPTGQFVAPVKERLKALGVKMAMN